MRATLLILAGVLALLATALALAPRLLTERAAEEAIEAHLRRTLGEVVIGHADLRFRPGPVVTLQGVRFATAGEAGAVQGAIDRLDVRLAIAPLLTGRITIREAAAAGLVVDVAAPGGVPASLGSLTDAAASGLPRHILVADGTIAFATRDGPRTLTLERASLTHEPETGVVDLEASLGLPGGAPLQLELEANLAEAPGRLPLLADLGLGPDGDRIRLRGIAIATPDGPHFDGRLVADLSDLGQAARLALPAASWPEPLTRLGRATLESALVMDPGELRLESLRLQIAEGTWTGTTRLGSGRMDLDLEGTRLVLDGSPAADWAALMPGLRSLAARTGSVKLRLGEAMWGGSAVRRIVIDARPQGDSPVEIERLAAELPGNAALELEGRLELAGEPALSGTGSLLASSPRETLAWLGIDISALPEDRLRSLRLSGRFTAGGGAASLTDAEIVLDGTSGTLALAYAAGSPARIAVRADLDRLNLGVLDLRPGAVLERLWAAAWPAGLDIAADARLQRLIVNGREIGDLHVTGDLAAGTLHLGTLAAGDLAGGRIESSGVLQLADGTINLALSGAFPSLGRLGGLLGLEVPWPLAGLGRAEVQAVGTAKPGSLDLDLELQGEGWRGAAAGRTGLGDASPAGTDLTFSVAVPDLPALLTRTGAGSLAEPLPARDFTATLTLEGGAGAPFGGRIELGLGQARLLALGKAVVQGPSPPRLDGRIELVDLDVGMVTGLYRALAPRLGLLPEPALWPGNWPTAPIDWRMLARLDAALTLAGTLRAGGATQSGIAAMLTLEDGALHLADLRLPVAGGVLGGRVDLWPEGLGVRLAGDLTLEDARAAPFFLAMRGGGDLTGGLDLGLEATSIGRSIADLVANLDGRLALRLGPGGLPGFALPPGPHAPRLPGMSVPYEALAGNLAIQRGVLDSGPAPLDLALAGDTLQVDARLDLLAWILEAAIGPTGEAKVGATRALIGPPDRLQRTAAPAR